ncbi:MAG: oxaloacetate decarboxylase, partial [Planctomycetes bacterium]|nr:oxaloacetate decarboxylase [Planctomycetota bacterium]
AVYDTLKALRDGVEPAELRPSMASADLLGQVTRREEYAQWNKEFMN